MWRGAQRHVARRRWLMGCLLLTALAGCGRSSLPACDSARTHERLTMSIEAIVCNSLSYAYDGRGADGTAPAPVLPPSAPPPLPPDMDQAIHAHRPRIMLNHWMAQVAARLHAVRPYRNMTITLSTQLQLDEGAALRRALPIRLTDIREVPASAGGPAGRRLCHATLQLGARADASGAAGPLPLWVRFYVNVPRRVYTYRSPKPGPIFLPVSYLDAGPQLQAPPLPAAQRNTLLLLGIDVRKAPPPLEPIELVQLHAMAALASDLERLTWGPSAQ